jgi:outer membrane lipoprotein-sorting protein
MSHLTSTQLHEIHYGFSPPPRHLHECTDCQKVLEGIRDENNALREILQGETQADGIQAGRANAWRGPRFLRMGLGIGAAAGFLGILLYVLYAPEPPVSPGAEDDPEKVFRTIEATITNATTLKIRFKRESPPYLLDSGELLLKEGNRVSFIIRRPINPPGGLDDEYLTVSDGKNVVNMVSRFGFVSIEGKSETLKDLNARLVAGVARGGLRFAHGVMPGAVHPLEASHWLWKIGDAFNFKAEGNDGDSKVLSYRLKGDTERGQYKLWYDPKSLRPLKLVVQNGDRDTTIETYNEFSIGQPIADDEFTFPPGKEEEIRGSMVSIQEYLDLAKGHKVREVWIERGELVAHLVDGINRGGKVRRMVHAIIPPAWLEFEEGIKNLSEGISPNRFHLANNYK